MTRSATQSYVPDVAVFSTRGCSATLAATLGSDYVEKFAYNLDGVVAIMGDMAQALAGREPPPGLSAEELLARSWCGVHPEGTAGHPPG